MAHAQDLWKEHAKELKDWYVEYRKAYRDIFTHNTSLNERGELIGDGIGEWIDDENRYEYWGEGLSALRINIANGSSRLKYGGDSGLNLGKKFSMLALEYHSLVETEREDEAQRVLNELFLALQAYRRLDMTANQMIYKYYAKYIRKDCPCILADNGIRFDGYSGFFIRDDLWYGLTSKGDQVGSDFLHPPNAEGKLLDVFRKLDKVKGCSERNGDFVSCFDKLLDLNLFNSQDQIVGLMHGLAFVKRFVPYKAKIKVDGEEISPRTLVYNIANALWRKTKACNRSLKSPNCKANCDGKSHGTGSNTKAFQKGINEVYNYITDNQVYPSFADHYIFGISQPISTGRKSFANSRFNTRLFTKLQVAGKVKCNCEMVKDAIEIKYYPASLEYALLYNDGDFLDKVCVDNKNNRSMSISLMIEAMLELKGHLPCFDSGGSDLEGIFECPERSGKYGWCIGGPLEFNDKDCKHAQTSIISPIDYLYMFNLLRVLDLQKPMASSPSKMK